MTHETAPRDAKDMAYRAYLAALIAGDRPPCQAEIEARLAAGTGVRELYEGLIQRSLYEVGTLWERGRVSVATEHLATAITESLLNLVYPQLFSRPQRGHSAVIACAANEYHQIGGRMVADIFELNGWRGYFLGSKVPRSDLLALIAQKRPDVCRAVADLVLQPGFDARYGCGDSPRISCPADPGGRPGIHARRPRARRAHGRRALPRLVS